MEKGSLSTEFLLMTTFNLELFLCIVSQFFSHQSFLNACDGKVKYKVPLKSRWDLSGSVSGMDVVFNFIKCWDCWVRAATSNSSLPSKYSQNYLFWQTSSNKETSDLLQGSPWAVGNTSVDTPCSLGITQGKGMASSPAGGSLGDASCVGPHRAGHPPFPAWLLAKPLTLHYSMTCPLCLTHTWSCLNCDSPGVCLGGVTLSVLVW